MSIVSRAVESCPGVAVHLQRILDRCDRRGELSGTLKLGDASLPVCELRVLQHLFGATLKTTRHGEHRLDLTQFLEQIPEPEAWIDDLYQALGRQRRNIVEMKAASDLKYRRLLGQLHLAYPDQTAIHEFLSQNTSFRHALDETGIEELRKQWFMLAELVAFLDNNRTPVGLSDLGARFFNDSKILRSGKLKSELYRWLNALETDGQCEPIPAEELLQKFGITDNATSIKVALFGNFRYRKNGVWHDWPCELRRNGESATLSLDNLADVESGEFPGSDTIITCENETPFNALIREDSPIPIVYTAGFPNAAVRILLEKLPGDTRLLHWGDSDLAGLRIACMLARIRSLSLWRCDLPELERHRELLLPTRESDKQAIIAMLGTTPGHPFAPELRFTAENGWLEQECWHPLN